MVKNLLAAALASVVLAACTVGPDYVRPDVAVPERFEQTSASAAAAPAADAEFWHSFGDPLLVELVDQALAANHDLRIGLARYEQANALLGAARLDRYPTLSASANASDARGSVDQLPGIARADRDARSHDVGIAALWELDFFGRIRRNVEAQTADTQASAADLATLQVALVADLATGYFRLSGQQSQLTLARSNATSQAETLRLIAARTENGRGTDFDVDRATAQLEATRARIPALEAAIAVSAHRIAVLAGASPESLKRRLGEVRPLPDLDATIAAATPGELLRRRPDIAAAERRLAASTARIGVATADLFPRFTLGGLIGSQALQASALFERDSETRVLSLGIDGSFLDVGRVRARIASANAATAADLAAYERSVLLALEETGNALVRVDESRRVGAHRRVAAAASERAAAQARLRFDNGAIDVLDVLDVERVQLDADDQLAQARTQQAVAVVALYRAMAGGWPQRLPSAVAQR